VRFGAIWARKLVESAAKKVNAKFQTPARCNNVHTECVCFRFPRALIEGRFASKPQTVCKRQ
jgi:hypothetical protein